LEQASSEGLHRRLLLITRPVSIADYFNLKLLKKYIKTSNTYRPAFRSWRFRLAKPSQGEGDKALHGGAFALFPDVRNSTQKMHGYAYGGAIPESGAIKAAALRVLGVKI